MTAAQVKKTLPRLVHRGKRPYGYMDPGQWMRFAHFFADHGVIKALPSTDDVLTNGYLPGEIP